MEKVRFSIYRFFVRLACIHSGGSGRVNIFDEFAAAFWKPGFDEML